MAQLTQWILQHWDTILLVLAIAFIVDLLVMIDAGISTTYTREESLSKLRKCSIAAIIIGVPAILMIMAQYMEL